MGGEQAVKGPKHYGAVLAPMWVVAQGGGHQNGVNIGQAKSSIWCGSVGILLIADGCSRP